MKRRLNKSTCEITSPRRFIEIWQSASSLAEVASKVQRNKNSCRVRAFRYRKQGIPLKQFLPEEIEFPDWEKLAEYAAGLAPPVPNLAGTTWAGSENLRSKDNEIAFEFRSGGSVVIFDVVDDEADDHVADEAIDTQTDEPADDQVDGGWEGTWIVESNVVHIKFEDEKGWIKYRGVIDGDTIRGKGEGKYAWNFSVNKVTHTESEVQDCKAESLKADAPS